MNEDFIRWLLISSPRFREAMIKYLIKYSPVVRNYINSIVRMGFWDFDKVANSQPVQNYIKTILGIHDIEIR